jgi:glycosyltransferase involved in cell wall biosynthesis
MKVFHVVESLDRGAVENWLLRMLNHARRSGQEVDWTFYCTLTSPGAREAYARKLGAEVIASPVPIHDKVAFARALRESVRNGGYDAVHCHHDLVSGFYLAALVGLPVKNRIVHVHNLDEDVLTPNRWKQALLRPGLRRTCLALADRIAANSPHSLEKFLAGRAPRKGRDSVHYLGIDSARFADAAPDRSVLRRQLGIKDEAPIMLFAGRMTQEKNPVFAVEVLAALRRRKPEVHGVFAGAGALEGAAISRAKALGQEGAAHFLGWREDIPEIMASSDWFILPHPEDPPEGFGIAVVEAQLAGLRLLMSHGVRDAPLLPTAVERRLSLADDPDKWADAAIALWIGQAPSREAAVAALNISPMNMDFALADLLGLYQ